jgi:hypothetical protein
VIDITIAELVDSVPPRDEIRTGLCGFGIERQRMFGFRWAQKSDELLDSFLTAVAVLCYA